MLLQFKALLLLVYCLALHHAILFNNSWGNVTMDVVQRLLQKFHGKAWQLWKKTQLNTSKVLYTQGSA